MINCKSLQIVVLTAIVSTTGWLLEHTAAHAGTPIGTAITYQGRLDDTGAPASGSYDFKFSLYDALTVGTQVGSTLTQTIVVTDGIFNTTLDFGAGAFTGDARFLEIEVQPNGGGGYTMLTPRQLLSTVPHATYAGKVQPVANVVVVAKSGGDYTTIGAALTAITTASANTPFLIRVGPGIYEETITLKSFVSIEGSGEGVTILRGPGGSTFDGTLYSLGAIVAEIRLLSIEAVTTTETKAIAISVVNGGTSLNFTDVTILASGGSADTYGVYIYNSSPTLSDVTINAVGGTNTRGVYTSLNSSPIVFNATADASGGTTNVAIYNSNNSSASLTHVIGTAGAGSTSYGLLNFNTANSIIKDSELSGITNSLINDGTSSAKVLSSQIDGPIMGGGFMCIWAYTDNLVALNEYCQDIGFLYAIGDTGPAGGIVFYVTNGGLNGLEAAPADATDSVWGCSGTSITTTGSAIGTGTQNTDDIVAGCVSAEDTAAEVADAFSLKGFTDWFLPSSDELEQLFIQQAFVGGLGGGAYWSSTECCITATQAITRSTSGPGGNFKTSLYRVRPVRAF